MQLCKKNDVKLFKIKRHYFLEDKMKRCFLKNKDLNLSYLDSECDGPVLITLHAHWAEGARFLPLSKALAPKWRVIALDQRGHGYSDHAKTYSRADHLSDINALFKHLSITEPVVMLGNSLGGLNSYQFAAKILILCVP